MGKMLKLVASLSAPLTLGAMYAKPAIARDTVKILVPYGVGGSADILARTLSEYLGTSLNQSVAVENRPGADGKIALRALAESDPNGNTFLIVSNGMMTPESYETFASSVLCCQLTAEEQFLVIDARSPIRSLKELLESGPRNYATARSPGSIYAGNELVRATGVAMQAIPYNGEAAAVASILASENDISFTFVWMTGVRNSSLKALAVMSDRRSPYYPDVPTIAEALSAAGKSGTFRTRKAFLGIIFPPHTPREKMLEIARSVCDFSNDATYMQRMRTLNLLPKCSDPEEFEALFHETVEQNRNTQ